MADYHTTALAARKKVLELVYKAQTSHIGSNFSVIDIMTVLFDHIDLDKDRFVVSKGWVAASLYYFLWKKGRITEQELNSFCEEGSAFIGLAEPIHKDIPIAGGSMGLGFPGAVGLAFAKKLRGEEGAIYCLMSDGEMQIGTTWESAMISAHHKLDNLIVIVDNNELCGMGETSAILNIGNLANKWKESGFTVHEIDGHDYGSIKKCFTATPVSEMPTCIIANTTKGKGVSFMERNNLWHYAQIKEEDYHNALNELCRK
ncbi:transketolase [Candidatus Uhrbacteria bacterium]|nr:transketolase [Candidatus Uhrbacteria bacterium]